MKRKINVIIATLLVVAMCLTMFPVRSEAVSYSGSSSYQSGRYYTNLTNVQLTGNQRVDIVNVAKSQIGYQEGGSSGKYSGEVAGGNNYTEYGRWYGSYIGVSWYNSVQWCAMFVSWCAYNAGISESIVDYDQYTETQVQHFKKAGRAHTWSSVQRGEYTPLPGDIVYFLSASGAESGRTVNHVGIVTGFSNNTLYTIEGNTSSAYFATDGGCCSDKTYDISSSRVVYICSPNYTTGDSLGGIYNENDFVPSNVQGVVFDPDYYAAKNPDVAADAYFGKNAENLYDHFIDNGFAEGRQGSPLFNIKDYISQNGDLNAAFGGGDTLEEIKQNRINAVKHFGSNGAFVDSVVRYTAKSTTIYKDFYARIQLTNATLNLSLSDSNVIAYTPSEAPAQIWHFEQQADGSYKITNTKNGLVLDVAEASKNSGANIQIYESNDSNAQRWNIYETFKKDGSSKGYILRSLVSPACVLTVASGSPAALTNVNNSTYTSQDSQVFKFEITQVVETTPEPSAPASSENPTSTPTQAPTSTPTQKPTSTPTQKPTQAPTPTPTQAPTPTPVVPTNSYADIGTDFYAKIGTALVENKGLSLVDTNVVLYTESTAPAQFWHFARQADKSYIITNQKTGQVLSVDGSSSVSGANVSIADADGSAGQKWYITVSGNYYTLIPACAPDCALDIFTASTDDLTNIQIYTANNTTAQQFSIKKSTYLDSVRNENVGTGFIAQITNINTGLNLNVSGLNVVLGSANASSKKQTFHFVRMSDGSYKISSAYNGLVLAVDGSCANDVNVFVSGSDNSESQRWFIHLKDGQYFLEPACDGECVLDVAGSEVGSNVLIKTYTGGATQFFTLSNVTEFDGDNLSEVVNGTLSAVQKEVLRNIIYAVETGGQTYGRKDYNDFTEAYANTSLEHAITIGAGCWYGPEAKTLLNLIRTTYPTKFAELDTAGIATDLDTADWSTYKLSKGSAKANCIVAIISSAEGIACQDALMDQQIDQYVKDAYNLGVTDAKALMMCVNIRHLGGLGAQTRMLNKAGGVYTVDTLYASLLTDLGNQAGAFRERNWKVYGWIMKYVD